MKIYAKIVGFVWLALSVPASALDTVVVFNEVLYHPAGDEPGAEFVEVVNQNVVDVDVSGWRISGGVDYVFPDGTVIGGGGGVLVVAEDPAALGVDGALGPFSGKLDNGGEVLRLRNHNDRLMDELEYGDRYPWPVAADGSGASLAKVDFLTTSGVAEQWSHSLEVGGTPGLENFVEGAGPGAPDSDNRALNRPVIDGSGAYNTADFEAGSFPAANVTNGSTQDIDGAMWLGRNDVLNEYFTVDLERLVAIDEIRLRNTHNRQFNDRGTLNFRITGSETVDAQQRLVGAVTILGGRLADVSGQNPPPIEVFTAADGLVETTVRYLRFEALTAVQNNTGLNEIEVYGDVVGGGGGGEEPPERATDVPVRINELAGTGGGGDFWVELFNGGGSELGLEGFVLNSEDGGEYVFPAGATIGGGGFLVLGVDLLGFDVRDGEKLTLYQPGKHAVLDVAIADDLGRGRVPDGEGWRFFSLIGDDATPGAANSVTLETGVVINEIMYHHRPQYRKPGIPARVETTVLQAYGATWRYSQNGNFPQGQGWAASAHAAGVGGWEEGPGPLAFEVNPLPLTPATTLDDPRAKSPYLFTTYFESEFVLDAGQLERLKQLRFSHLIDDGAVFYLNGVEIERYKMAGGVVTAATAASGGGEAVLDSLVEGVENLVVGVNRLSVEVHQSAVNSSDVVMGLQVEAEEAALPGVPGTAYAENREEWIELYNRGATAVELGGWELERGVRWEFPAGTSIGAGGYLVVARDAEAFAADYPGVPVVGDFDGTLGNGGDLVVLLDEKGNPADEVAYADGAPWPGGADGGGSSMELRNPELENSVPAAWSASDNSGTSEWRTYTYRATAAQPVFTPGTGIFHEVRLGLLDGGEVLIDDFTVTEDPDGEALQLVQNPTFTDAASWRLLGTHQNSGVVEDAGESVLRIEATARMNYMNNLIETTLKSGGVIRRVRRGSDYEISFRAKWLSGTPQFRVELYYNQWARTFILDQPSTSGTPGAVNSVYAADTGPVVYGLRHEPVVPVPGEEIEVSARAQDPDGVASMLLYYTLNGRAYTAVAMAEDAGGVWRGRIPGQSNRRLVQFYVEATDAGAGGLTGVAPLGGRDSRAVIGVSSSLPVMSQSVRLLMLASEASAMHVAGDILDNQRYGCTIVVNDRVAVYDCGIRLRGSMFSRGNSGSAGLSLKFPADQPYRGLHSTITTRKGNRREILVKHIATQAGGVHDNYNDLIQQFGHITPQDGRVRMEMARFGGEYVDGIPDERGGAGGTVFKMEGMRVFQTTDDGTAEGKKRPMPIGWVGSFDIADQGDDVEMYRHNLRMNSNQEVDDYSSIMRMCKVFSMSGQELEDAAAEALNVDMWMRQFAVLSLCGIGDTYSQGNPHNLNFHVRPEDGRVEPMPWDWDFTFNRGANSALWGNKNLSKIISRPAYTRLFYGHLRDIINRTYNTTYLSTWFRHFGAISRESYTGNLGYVRNRGNFVLSRLPAAVPFAITTNGGGDFSVEGARATLGGRGWIDVREVFV
ncbi:MAG: lamin tail domain-containing protein, partial [Verrucomicrobiales bacterium]|nr:lamin tail domain-containing protein [Verrucomicrobiales bacterium]